MLKNCLPRVIYLIISLISLVGSVIRMIFLLCQVASLLGSHPDLMEECEDFITYVEKTGNKTTDAFYVF